MKKKAKAKTKSKKIRVRKVVLRPAEVVRIVAHKAVIPVVAQAKPGVVEVAAVPKAHPKKMGWMEYLFGQQYPDYK